MSGELGTDILVRMKMQDLSSAAKSECDTLEVELDMDSTAAGIALQETYKFKPTQNFTGFPNLPKELRDKIWEYVLVSISTEPGRIVSIQEIYCEDGERGRFTSPDPAVGFGAICRESFYIFAKTNPSTALFPRNSPHFGGANLEEDILLFSAPLKVEKMERFMWAMNPEKVALVKYVALEFQIQQEYPSLGKEDPDGYQLCAGRLQHKDKLAWLYAIFPNLQRIVFVPYDDWWDASRYLKGQDLAFTEITPWWSPKKNETNLREFLYHSCCREIPQQRSLGVRVEILELEVRTGQKNQYWEDNGRDSETSFWEILV